MQLTHTHKLDLDVRLTPEQRQGLAILMLDLPALAIELQAACEANPVLEEVGEDLAELEAEEAAAEIADGFDSPSRDDFDGDDWIRWLEALPRVATRSARSDPWPDREPVARPLSLLEHLEGQIATAKVPPPVARTAALVAGCLDEDGFLEASLGEIRALAWAEGVEELDDGCIEQALSLVRELDPTGVGWWTRQESLVAQLRLQGGAGSDLPMRLLTETWEDLVSGRWRHVAARLGVSSEAMREGCSVLRRLDPRPGARFAHREAEVLVADLVVRRIDGRIHVETSERGLPRLQVSAGYRELWRSLGRGEQDAEARGFLRGYFESAEALLRNVHRRGDTLRRIAELIFLHQPEFLDHGAVALRPMTMTEVAQALELSVSTISRAVANKYVATPRGTFPLRSFFSSGLPSASGDSSTGAAARERVRALIAAEPADAPLTDAAIRSLLQQERMAIAPSTVRKYREALGIPASHLRRQLAPA